MKWKNKIIEPKKSKGIGQAYSFSNSVVHFLNLVSGVDKNIIANATVYSRSPFRFLPWYNSQRGGGAITLSSSRSGSITFTENFFSTDQRKFNKKAYLNNSYHWLRLAAHEVKHLQHGLRYKFLLFYLFAFAFQYIVHGHDKAPLEIEADEGSNVFDEFYSFGIKKYNMDLIDMIFDSNFNNSHSITLIDKYWIEFTEYKNKQ